MISPLFKRDMTSCIKVFVILFAVICLYTTVIIYMYNPELSDMLSDYQKALPEVMSAVGMTGIATNLLEWIQIYLYGFIMLLFPLIFIIILVQKMVMGYIDSGSMASLLATPNSRGQIIRTQVVAAVFWVTILIGAVTVVGILSSEILFPGELDIKRYLLLNLSTLLVQLDICGITFLAAVICSEVKYYYTLGAGIPILFFLLRMLSNMGEKLGHLKYVIIYTLLPAGQIVSGEGGYAGYHLLMALIAAVLFGGGIWWFRRRDLSL
ncbi:MAG: ABC transporter permease subunit [Roseburia sp.]